MHAKICFLIGAGRSGTTLLYKLLALHSQVGFITNYNRDLPAWIPSSLLLRPLSYFPFLKKAMWFKESGNAYFIDRAQMQRLFIMPIEGEFIYEKCGLPLTPNPNYSLPDEVRTCLQHQFKRLHTFTGGRILISKRTANNRRLLWLHQTFPDAYYINLIRDGRDVAHSLSQVSWWPTHTVWWAGKKPSELEAEGVHPLEICARNWVEEVHAIQKGFKSIPHTKILEMRYENLLNNPIPQLKKVFDFMGLSFHPKLVNLINSLSMSHPKHTWKRKWNLSDIEIVVNQQKALLDELDYI